MMDRFFASNKKSAFLLMCGLIIFLISYFFVTTPKIHNTIFYALTLLPLLCAVEKKHLIYLHRSWLINGLVLFLLYSFSTTFWSDFYSKELLFRTFKRVLYIYGLFLACYVVIDAFPSFPARLLQAGSLSLSIFACICIFLFLMETHPHFIHDPIRMWGLGALYHPSFFSGILLCYVVGLFVHLKEHNFVSLAPIVKSIYLVGLFFMMSLVLSVLVLADSRSAAVCLVVIAAFYGIFERSLIWTIAAVLCIIFSFTIILYIDPNIFLSRSTYRLEIWSVFINKWQECSYLFGCGMSGWKTTIIQAAGEVHMHAHSIYIGQLHTGGIIQLIGYLLLLASFIYEGISTPESKPWALILVGGAVMTMFDGSKILTTPSPLWLVLLIPMSIIASNRIVNANKLLNKKRYF